MTRPKVRLWSELWKIRLASIPGLFWRRKMRKGEIPGVEGLLVRIPA